MQLRFLVIALGVLALAATGLRAQKRGPDGWDAQYPPLAKDEGEKKILNVLEEMRRAGRLYASVPRTDGRALRVLAEAVGAKTVVEIGTSTGYSGLWFCLALRNTGGKLLTFELDKERAATARRHFRLAGVEDLVTLTEGDAHQNVKQVKGPVDIVFIDADKEGYVDYLNTMLPLVRPGGLILAHNTDMAAVEQGYLREVARKPELETVFYLEGNGLSVSVKKR